MSEANGVVAAVSKALPLELQILDLFQAGHVVAIGPTDVERMLGVSKGTVSAKLRMMADAGYLQAIDKGRYQLGGKVAMLWTSHMTLMANRVQDTQQMVCTMLSPVRDLLLQMANSGRPTRQLQQEDGL